MINNKLTIAENLLVAITLVLASGHNGFNDSREPTTRNGAVGE